MFGTLFDVGKDKDANVFALDKSISLCPFFWDVYKHERMGSKVVKWIVLVYDYKSPYRNIPFEERIEYVTYMLFEKKKHWVTNDPLITKAVAEYRKMQYDPLIEQYNAMRDMMSKKTAIYKSMEPDSKTLEMINELEISMQKSSEALEKMKQLILKDQTSEMKIQGGNDGFSILEQEHLLKKD